MHGLPQFRCFFAFCLFSLLQFVIPISPNCLIYCQPAGTPLLYVRSFCSLSGLVNQSPSHWSYLCHCFPYVLMHQYPQSRYFLSVHPSSPICHYSSQSLILASLHKPPMLFCCQPPNATPQELNHSLFLLIAFKFDKEAICCF
jgi:hypothetical protein